MQDRVIRVLCHLIPAYIVDTICTLIGQKPFLAKLIHKLHSGIEPLEWFANRQWIWANDNVVALSEELNTADRDWFPCRVNNLDWHEYLINHVYTIRKHILKYDDKTIEACKLRLKRLDLVFGLIKGIACLALVLIAMACFYRLFVLKVSY